MVAPDGAALLRLEPDDPAPAYVQLRRRLRVAVADGDLRPGDRLPSIRDLARRLGVSPNTVGRAYAELAREGVIVARAGSGSEVAPREALDRPALARARRERLAALARQVVVRGLALGFGAAEIADAVAADLAARGQPVPARSRPGSLGADEGPLLSARNRLRGTVTAVRLGDVVAEVSLTLEDGNRLVAAVTRASVDRLGLAAGRPVSVYVKATELVLGR